MQEVQRDLDKQKKSIEDVNKALASPQFRRFAAERLRLAKMEEVSRQRELREVGRIRWQSLSMYEKMREASGRFFKAGEDGWKKLTGAAILGFSAYGMFSAGLSGTSEGFAISHRFQLLAREITQLFLPAIRAVIDWLGRLVEWFRRLSGLQQRMIGSTVLWTLGLIGLIVVFKGLGMAIAALSANPLLAIAGVLGIIIAQMQQLKSLGGGGGSSNKDLMRTASFAIIGALLGNLPGALIGVVIGAMMSGSDSGSAIGGALGGKQKRDELSAMKPMYEQVQESYRRVQLAAVSQTIGGDKPEEVTAKTVTDILILLRQSLQMIQKQPGVRNLIPFAP